MDPKRLYIGPYSGIHNHSYLNSSHINRFYCTYSSFLPFLKNHCINLLLLTLCLKITETRPVHQEHMYLFEILQKYPSAITANSGYFQCWFCLPHTIFPKIIIEIFHYCLSSTQAYIWHYRYIQCLCSINDGYLLP